MFRRLEPISPPPPNRHRSNTSAVPSIDEHDTSDADTNADDEASLVNKIMKTPGASTPDAAGLSASVSQSKRKRKPKRRLTLGKDPAGKWKRRKLQLEEQQIQKALEDNSDGQGDEEIFDCIRVAGGFIMRGLNAGQQPPSQQTPGGEDSATPATFGKPSKPAKKPTKLPRRNIKGRIKGGQQHTFIIESFLKGPHDESDSSSLSSLSELEDELGMKGSTTNKKDTKGNSVAEEDLPQVLGQAERSGIGASKDDATGLTSSEPVFNPAPPVDRSKLEVPAEPLNIEPVTEIPETPQDTAMLQVNDGDEAAGSPDSQPAVTPSPQKVLQVRESQASADIESPPTVFDDHRTSSMAEKIPEDRTRAHDKVSSQSVCASGGRKTKKGLVNCREIDVDADRQRDDLEGRDDLARVNSSGDTLMDVAEEPSAAHPNTTTLSNIQSSAVTTPNIDKSRRSNRLSYSPPLSRENCERRWNLNAPTSLVGESSKRSSSLGIPERSVAISDKRSDGPSAKRRAIVSTSTSTPPPRKTANSKAQNNTSSIFSLHTWKTLLSPSTSRWRSGMSGSKAPTEPSGGCHEPDVTPEASDGDLKRDSITDVAPSVPEQEPQSVAIQNPLVETERKQIPSPTPPEASDSPALAKRPTPPGDEPTTPTEPAPGDAPEISDSNSPQSSNGSKMATRTRGRPRMAALPIAYSIAPTKEFNVPQQVPKPPPLQTVPSTVGQHAWRAVSNNSTVRAAKSKGFGAWRAVPMNASQSASAAPPTFFTLQTETASQPVTALLPHEAPEPTSRLNCWRAVSTQSKKPATASSPKPSDSNISSTAQKITPDKVALTRNGSPGASGISPPDAMDLDTPEKAPVTSKSTESMKTSTTSADKPHRTVAVSATSTGTPSKPPPSADKPEPSVPVTESSKEEPAAKEGFIPAAENTVAGNVGTDAASPTLETPVPRNTADPATHEVSLPTVAADAKGDQQEVDDTRSDLSSVVDMEKINEGADILLWAAMGGSPALAPTLISDVPEPITPTPTTATGEPSEPAKRRKSHPRKKKAAAKPRNKAKLPPPQKSLTTVFKLSPQLLKTIVKPDNSETAPPPLPSPPPPTRLVTHMEKPIMSSIPPPPLPPSAASFTAVNIPRPQPYRRPEPTNDTTTAIPKSATASTIAGPPTTLNPTAAPKPLPPLGSFQPPKAQIKPQNQAQPPKPIQALGQPAKRTPSIGDLLASRKKQEEQRRTTSRLDSLSNRPKPPSRQTPIPPPAYVKPAAAATPPASIGKDGDETSTDEDDPKRLASTIPAIHPLGPSMIAKELPRPPAYVPKLRPASATDTPERAPSNPLSGTSKMPPLVRPGNFLYWDPNSAEKPQSKSPALGTTSGGKEWKLPTLERTGSPTLPLSLAPSASSFGFPPASTSLQPLVPLPLRPPNPPPPPKATEMLFIIHRREAPEIKLCIPGADIATDTGKLQWDKLSSVVSANLPFDVFHEALVVNWCVLVDDQESLDRGMDLKAYRKGDNEVVVVSVDETGRPKEKEVVETLVKGRKKLRGEL